MFLALAALIAQLVASIVRIILFVKMNAKMRSWKMKDTKTASIKLLTNL